MTTPTPLAVPAHPPVKPRTKARSKRYSGKDVHAWKVQTPDGKIARNAKGELLNHLDGYAAAMDHVRRIPGTVAVRV